ncbi:hypothetical protein F4820DRAFT_461178 [Hypoxylon rubiginosum]|uniref:Uncharacterized protein n=1 Tax=Hypoxylon rubiginosum TaxID=110542 RepID=A0ACB9YQB3_9PEZI|nr:hypothetical protein F4820DRAFT_461178 [Hypoxylon rubiginosum]
MDFSAIPDAEGSVEKFLHIPYNQRWEYLKPTMVRIYMEENSRFASLAKRMKDVYSFDAHVHQYRHRFNKWDVKKRITTEEKGAVISALGKRRLREGVSTSDATLNQGGFEKAVDKKQLKRYIDESIRKSEPLTWSPGLFLHHHLPYAAFLGSHVSQHPSPSGAGPATPQYLTINSPQGNGSPSASQNGGTPTMQLIQKKILLDRAKLLIEGRAQELMAQMTSDERKSTITWLHDFWMYSFMTTKYWGRGPKTWTLSLINFKSFAGNPVPSTPGQPIEQRQASESLSPSGNNARFSSPTQLCRWTIHYLNEVNYEHIPSPQPVAQEESEEQFDIDDESTWSPWPKSDPSPSLSSTITQGLRENIFSAVQSETLPIAADSVMNTIKKSAEELQTETFGFAIMSRNVDVLDDMLGSYLCKGVPKAFSTISPFHLAAQYLDGGTSCCLVMDTLTNKLHNRNSIGLNYVNDSGHTVLDTLFVTILRSHSTVPPHILGDAFTDQSRYPGQEVDPCGRWDADSPCIRQRYASGNQTIPREWKHMFCHTSVQAVCHCLSSIFLVPQRPDVDTRSGLFSRRCHSCGLKMSVGPLHALILTAFYLANYGCPGETLFGMVSCLVCLLVHNADPCSTSEVSVPAMFGLDTADDECQHSQVNAAELALRVPPEMVSSWTSEAKQGWNALVAVLEHDIATRRSKRMTRDTLDIGPVDAQYSEADDTENCGHFVHRLGKELVYCGNQQLGRLWAIIQAELLTYRRLSEQDPWLSTRLDMADIVNGPRECDDAYFNELVSSDEDIEGYGLKSHSRCGLFDAMDPGCARIEEACESFYANLDEWKRTTLVRAREL